MIKGAIRGYQENLYETECSLIITNFILDSTTKIELIPSAELLLDHPHHTFRASDYSCPKGAKPFQLNTDAWVPVAPIFVTCHCEDHCSWYRCRLDIPPSKCLEGIKGIWKWDKKSSYWVAQMDQGITGIRLFHVVFSGYLLG